MQWSKLVIAMQGEPQNIVSAHTCPIMFYIHLVTTRMKKTLKM